MNVSGIFSMQQESPSAVLLQRLLTFSVVSTSPHGDHVIVINCAKAVLTGNKLENKYYRWHTGYIGGLKEVQYSKLMSEKPEKAMQLAIEGMLPNNTLGRKAATRMRLYAGAEHKNGVQKPEEFKY